MKGLPQKLWTRAAHHSRQVAVLSIPVSAFKVVADIYDLSNVPHHDRQEVLKVRDGDYELHAVRKGAGYWLHLFVLKGGKKMYIRMERPAATVEDVRREGRWMSQQSH